MKHPLREPPEEPTKLRQLLIRKANGQKTPVDIDINIGIPRGRYANVFKSYLEMLARERISILNLSFDYVSEIDREMIWQNLFVTNIHVINLIV